MTKGRMEAFSDGVLAILITIMVLELKVPHGDQPGALRPLLPVFTSYVLSYIYLGIYWNNHHHLLHAARHVDGRILWANLHLLFWLSLFPAVTQWMGETRFAPWPVAVYGVVLLMAACAYWLLVRALLARHGQDSVLARAIGSDFKGNISIVVYLVAVPLAFVNAGVAYALYASVALLWFVPDRRIERALAEGKE
jgi:uncharacterized membrane protein